MSGIPELHTLARGKFNLCLLLGPQRDDGYHQVATVIVPVELADGVSLGPSGSGDDEVVCPGVEGDNLALRAVTLFRERSGWRGDAVRITIDKRIPVAAGMAGGSADAAAALGLAARASGLPDAGGVARDVAPELGADVPAMLDGHTVLATGTGTELQRLAAPAPMGLLVLPSDGGLSTPDVFRHAGVAGARRPQGELDLAAGQLASAGASEGWLPPADLVGRNDLGPSARALDRGIDASIAAALEAGADHAFVTGSGPTVIGLFLGEDGLSRAAAAAASIDRQGLPRAIVTAPSHGPATIEPVT